MPKDYPTIQGAVDASVAGDDILVAPGVYEETVVIEVPRIQLTSEIAGGAVIQSTKPGVVAVYVRADSCSITGFKVDAPAPQSYALGLGGAEFIVDSCELSGRDTCVSVGGDGVIRNSTVSQGNFGIRVFLGADVLVESSTVVGNGSLDSWVGGGVLIHAAPGGTDGSNVKLVDCRLIGNEALIAGGAVVVDGSTGPAHQVTLKRCLLFNNRSGVGGAVQSVYSNVALHSCTIVGNTSESSSGLGAVIHLEGNGAVHTAVIDRCIIAFNTGWALGCIGMAPTVSCSDTYGNTDDSICSGDAGGNFSLDPLLCDLEREDFTISTASPCAPPSSRAVCGLIGAFPPVCVSAVTETTWGAIKYQHVGRRDGAAKKE